MKSFVQTDKKRLVTMAGLLFVTALLNSCGENHAKKAEKQVKAKESATAIVKTKTDKVVDIIVDDEDNIRYCVTSYVNGLHPGQEKSNAERTAVEQVYETLLRFKTGTMNSEPALAKSYSISDDKLSYIFELRDDVIFHSNLNFSGSRKLDASDVVFSISRLINPEHPDYVGSDNPFVKYGLADAIVSVEQLDTHKMEIKLKHPMATFLHNLINPHVLPIKSYEYYQKMQAEGKLKYRDEHPIGTGPWSFYRKLPNSDIQFRAHKGYWGGDPNEPFLTIRTVENPMDLIDEVERNGCDVTTKIPTTIGHDTQTHYRRAHVYTMDGLSVAYLALNNNSQTALHQPMVRRAMMYALNRKRIVRDVYRNHAKVAHSLISASIWGSHPEYMRDQFAYHVNPNKALQLLAQAGYPNGKGIEPFVIQVAKNHPTLKAAAQYIALDLNRVGFHVNVVTTSNENINIELRNHDYQAILTTVQANYRDPESQYMQVLGLSEYNNQPNWYDDSFMRSLRDSVQSYYVYNRRGMFDNMAGIFAANLPVLPIAEQKQYIAMAHDVHNYTVGTRTTARFDKISKHSNNTVTR